MIKEDEILIPKMLINLNNKQLRLRNELHEYLAALLTPELRAELSQSEYFEGGGPEFKKR